MKMSTNLREPVSNIPLGGGLRSIDRAVIERLARKSHNLRHSNGDGELGDGELGDGELVMVSWVM